MAKINPVKLKQDADKLEKAGKLDQAIALYKQVIEDNPRDWNIINKVGDLYAKLNKTKEAADEYAKVADFYAKDGFHLKAIAIWKKINKLDATALEPYLNLAELYAKQGLMMEAKSQYQIVVDEYIKRGKMREAGDVLKKMADIDPGDLKIRSKLADLYTREGNSGKAVEEHVAIAEELNKKGHLAEALQVLEKGLKIDAKSGAPAPGAGPHPPRPEELRQGRRSSWRRRCSGTPNDPDILAPAGRGLPRRASGSRRRRPSSSASSSSTRTTRTRASRWRACTSQQGQFDRPTTSWSRWSRSCVERRDGRPRGRRSCSRSCRRTRRHVKSWPSWSRSTSSSRRSERSSPPTRSSPRPTSSRASWRRRPPCSRSWCSASRPTQQHKTKLAVRARQAGRGGAERARAPPPPAELMEEEFDLRRRTRPRRRRPRRPPAAARAGGRARARGRRRPPAAPARARSSRPPGPLSDEDQEFIDEHLAEGKVFRKYGLIDKAADQFEAVVARFPDNVEARQELREVYKEKGQTAKAAEQCLALAEIFRLRATPPPRRSTRTKRSSTCRAPRVRPRRPPLPRPAAPAPARAAARRRLRPSSRRRRSRWATRRRSRSAAKRTSRSASREPAPRRRRARGRGEPRTSTRSSRGGQDLPSPFIDEEPAAAAAEEDVSIGFDEATLDAPIAAEAPAEEVGFGVEDEFPLDEPAPAPPPPPPAARPSRRRRRPRRRRRRLRRQAGTGREGRAAREARAAAARAKPAPRSSAAGRPPAPRARPRRPRHRPPSCARLRARARRPAVRPRDGSPSISSALLEEVESYVSLGFVDDAKEALREGSRALQAGHPVLAAEDGGARPRRERARARRRRAPAEDRSGLRARPRVGRRRAAYDPLGDLADDVGPRARAVRRRGPRWATVGAAPSEAESADETSAGEDLLSTADGAGRRRGEGMDLGTELGELFGAQSAVEEPHAEGASTELGRRRAGRHLQGVQEGRRQAARQGGLRHPLQPRHRLQGDGPHRRGHRRVPARGQGRDAAARVQQHARHLLPREGHAQAGHEVVREGPQGARPHARRSTRACATTSPSRTRRPGTMDKALSLFTDLYGQDANFRDVADEGARAPGGGPG